MKSPQSQVVDAVLVVTVGHNHLTSTFHPAELDFLAPSSSAKTFTGYTR